MSQIHTCPECGDQWGEPTECIGGVFSDKPGHRRTTTVPTEVYTCQEVRERLLSALENARQANVGYGWCVGDLFKGVSERQMTESGVQVVALADFNAALDSEFPVEGNAT